MIKKFINKKIYNRSLTILNFFKNKVFFVYNGKIFISLKITKEMIGYKFGEFIFTKKKPIFKSKKDKKLKKKLKKKPIFKNKKK
jgi:ribosomal protein S19